MFGVLFPEMWTLFELSYSPNKVHHPAYPSFLDCLSNWNNLLLNVATQNTKATDQKRHKNIWRRCSIGPKIFPTKPHPRFPGPPQRSKSVMYGNGGIGKSCISPVLGTGGGRKKRTWGCLRLREGASLLLFAVFSLLWCWCHLGRGGWIRMSRGGEESRWKWWKEDLTNEMMVTLISISIDQHMSKPVHLLPPSPRTLLGGTDSRAATGRTLDQELEKYSDSRNNLLKFQSTQCTAQELGNKH